VATIPSWVVRWAEANLPASFIGHIEIHFGPGGAVGGITTHWNVRTIPTEAERLNK
jgi:hypothetical protein